MCRGGVSIGEPGQRDSVCHRHDETGCIGEGIPPRHPGSERGAAQQLGRCPEVALVLCPGEMVETGRDQGMLQQLLESTFVRWISAHVVEESVHSVQHRVPDVAPRLERQARR